MKGIESGQNYLEKKKKVGEPILPNFKLNTKLGNNQRQFGIGIRRDI